MVYDPEPKEAGGLGAHPEAGQPLTEDVRPARAQPDQAAADRNARRRAQRAAAKSAVKHKASTGRDLDALGTDRTQSPDA